MKKKLAAIVMSLAMSAQLLVPMAAGNDDITVELDGKKLNFDVSPIIMDGRTMVPMRVIFEELGYNVEWNEQNRAVKAVKGDDIINMRVDFYTFWKSGAAYQTDVAPCILDGRTLVPVRVISEASGCKVDWDASARKVIIAKNNEQAVPTVTPTATTAPTSTATPNPSASPEPTPRVNSEDIIFKETSITVDENKNKEIEYDLKASVYDGKQVWKSSDSTIAVVSKKGVVTGMNAGTCVVSLTIDGQTSYCDVTVKNVPQPPEVVIKGYDTTKLFVDGRNYLKISIHNVGEYPLKITGEGDYSYIDGAEGFGKEAMYDIYTMTVKAQETVIPPGTYKEIEFKKDGQPKIGSKTLKEDFDETFNFKMEYDGKTYTATKYKMITKNDKNNTDNKQKEDFVIR